MNLLPTALHRLVGVKIAAVVIDGFTSGMMAWKLPQRRALLQGGSDRSIGLSGGEASFLCRATANRV